MDQDEENIDLIDAYVRGELHGSALADFEGRRRNDPVFDKEVSEYLLIIKGIRASEETAFVNKLKTWDSELDQREKKGKVVSLQRIFSIAAAVTVLALAGGYFFWSGQHNSNALFDQYFQPYDNVISSRSDEQDIREKAMRYYDNKEYDKAVTYLRLCSAERPGDLAVQCYLGIAYLADDRPDEAKLLFEKLVQGEPNLFKEVSEWYLALTYVKLDQKDYARILLKEILKQPSHVFREQANELMRKI